MSERGCIHKVTVFIHLHALPKINSVFLKTHSSFHFKLDEKNAFISVRP